jgi:hypothetical protein
MLPSGSFTVRPAPVEATPAAALIGDAPNEVTNELSATQSRLNSRRFSNLVSLLFTIDPFHCANRSAGSSTWIASPLLVAELGSRELVGDVHVTALRVTRFWHVHHGCVVSGWQKPTSELSPTKLTIASVAYPRLPWHEA